MVQYLFDVVEFSIVFMSNRTTMRFIGWLDLEKSPKSSCGTRYSILTKDHRNKTYKLSGVFTSTTVLLRVKPRSRRMSGPEQQKTFIYSNSGTHRYLTTGTDFDWSMVLSDPSLTVPNCIWLLLSVISEVMRWSHLMGCCEIRQGRVL